MTQQFEQQILQRLDALAAKLGVTANEVWGILLRQARVEVITSIGEVGIGALLFFLIMKTVPKIPKWDAEDSEGKLIGGVVLCILGAIFGFIMLIDGLTKLPTLLFNPQFWALRQLL